MLSLVDLNDFAEICRALEDHVSSGGRVDGPVGPRRRARTPVRAPEDGAAAENGGPPRRFYRKAGGLE